MAHWIHIEEGSYLVEEAFLFTSSHSSTALEDALIEVYLNGSQERRVRGHAMANNLLMVELLEDHDVLDILLDLGDGFHYLLEAPSIRSGKVFSPDVKSLLQFIAQGPLQKLSDSEYLRIRTQLDLLERRAGHGQANR